jgi:general secretion pathway protein D
MKLGYTCLAALLFTWPSFGSAEDAAAPKSSGCNKPAFTPDPELADIFTAYSARTGKKFIIDPRVRAIGGITGVDPAKITYEQLIALATVHQFAVVPQGDVTIVLPDANARQMPSPVFYDRSFKALDDEWVTLLLTVKNACAVQLVPILRPLMPQAAHFAGNPQTNQLVLTDRAVNARRIAGLVGKLDDSAPPGQRCSALVPTSN